MIVPSLPRPASNHLAYGRKLLRVHRETRPKANEIILEAKERLPSRFSNIFILQLHLLSSLPVKYRSCHSPLNSQLTPLSAAWLREVVLHICPRLIVGRRKFSLTRPAASLQSLDSHALSLTLCFSLHQSLSYV